MADLVTITSPRGVRFTVERATAPRFQALVTQMENMGLDMRQQQSGGYNPRNIAGTNVPSNHASGRAIDVNWQDNPRGRGFTGADDPTRQFRVIDPEQARRLSRELGFNWGGDWRNPDPMHFEVNRRAAPPDPRRVAELSQPVPRGPPTPQATEVAQAPAGAERPALFSLFGTALNQPEVAAPAPVDVAQTTTDPNNFPAMMQMMLGVPPTLETPPPTPQSAPTLEPEATPPAPALESTTMAENQPQWRSRRELNFMPPPTPVPNSAENPDVLAMLEMLIGQGAPASAPVPGQPRAQPVAATEYDDPTAQLPLERPPNTNLSLRNPPPPAPAPTAPPPVTGGPPVSGPTAAAAPTEQRGWSGWLQRPENVALLRQMGLQLMTPTWGGPMANLAASIGAGSEAQAGTVRAQMEADRLADESTRHDLDRQSRERVAHIGAESRTDVANIRGQFSLERAMQAAGVRAGTQDAQTFRTIYNTQLAQLQRRNRELALLDPSKVLSEEQIQMAAEAAATQAFRAQRREVGRGPLSGENNSVIPPSAPGGGDGQGGQNRPPAGQNEGAANLPPVSRPGVTDRLLGRMENLAPDSLLTPEARTGREVLRGDRPNKGSVQEVPPATARPPAAAVNPPAAQQMGWEEIMGNEQQRNTIMSDPAYRRLLRERRPDLAPQLDMIEQLTRGLPGGPR